MGLPSRFRIFKTIQALDDQFRSEADPLRKLFICKICTLELGGWIESAQDEILIDKAALLHGPHFAKRFEEDVIKKNYSFGYEKLAQMIIQLVGRSGLIELEASVDPQIWQDMKSELGNLKTIRDSYAHTSLDLGNNIGPNTPAPSQIKAMFSKIFHGLCELDRKLRTI